MKKTYIAKFRIGTKEIENRINSVFPKTALHIVNTVLSTTFIITIDVDDDDKNIVLTETTIDAPLTMLNVMGFKEQPYN